MREASIFQVLAIFTLFPLSLFYWCYKSWWNNVPFCKTSIRIFYSFCPLEWLSLLFLPCFFFVCTLLRETISYTEILLPFMHA